jgi:lipid II:glycine glycyltransferase (peptidoglycan interpeptide bridge formation enzyme)
MKKLIVIIMLAALTGCPTNLELERNSLNFEVDKLQKDIGTAKEIELLKAQRNALKQELDAFSVESKE